MPTSDEIEAIKPGDRITFLSPTRSGARKATRVVVTNGRGAAGCWVTTVKFNGWAGFIVRPTEILEIHTTGEDK